MAGKRVKSTKPKKLKAGVSVFDDRERLKLAQEWHWSHYCSRCGETSKTKSVCSSCENRG